MDLIISVSTEQMSIHFVREIKTDSDRETLVSHHFLTNLYVIIGVCQVNLPKVSYIFSCGTGKSYSPDASV